MQILPNYVKGLSALHTWMQFIKESKQGKIKESWSVVQRQMKNKYRVTKALGDTPRHPEIEAEPCLRATERERCGSKRPCTHCWQLLRSPISPPATCTHLAPPPAEMLSIHPGSPKDIFCWYSLALFSIYLIFFCPLEQAANASPAVKIVENSENKKKREKIRRKT